MDLTYDDKETVVRAECFGDDSYGLGTWLRLAFSNYKDKAGLSKSRIDNLAMVFAIDFENTMNLLGDFIDKETSKVLENKKNFIGPIIASRRLGISRQQLIKMSLDGGVHGFISRKNCRARHFFLKLDIEKLESIKANEPEWFEKYVMYVDKKAELYFGGQAKTPKIEKEKSRRALPTPPVQPANS